MAAAPTVRNEPLTTAYAEIRPAAERKRRGSEEWLRDTGGPPGD
jgi:hypothetical protein